MKTKSFNKNRLRNLEYFQFAESVLTLCREANIVKLNAALTPLEKALQEEDLLLNLRRKEPGSQELALLDDERGKAWRVISLIVQTELLSKKADLLAAARQIDEVLGRYPRLIYLPHLQQTGGIKNLVTDLRSTDLTAAVQKLELKEKIDNLDAINKAFKALYLKRLKSGSYETRVNVRERRTVTDKEIETVTNLLDALHTLEASESTEQLITLYNNLVIKQSRLLARRTVYGRAASEKRYGAIEQLLYPMLPALITEEGMTVAFAGRTLGTNKDRHYLINLRMGGTKEYERWYRIEGEKLVYVPEDKLPRPKRKKKPQPASDFTVPSAETTPTLPAQGGSSSGDHDGGAEGSIGGGL